MRLWSRPTLPLHATVPPYRVHSSAHCNCHRRRFFAVRRESGRATEHQNGQDAVRPGPLLGERLSAAVGRFAFPTSGERRVAGSRRAWLFDRGLAREALPRAHNDYSASGTESPIVASAGRASPASTSTALMIPTGTGHAGWWQCFAPICRVRGPSPLKVISWKGSDANREERPPDRVPIAPVGRPPSPTLPPQPAVPRYRRTTSRKPSDAGRGTASQRGQNRALRPCDAHLPARRFVSVPGASCRP
jgi:hypothetical protein